MAVSIPVFARAVGVSDYTVRKMIEEGAIQCSRPRRQIRIPRSEIERVKSKPIHEQVNRIDYSRYLD